MKNRPQTGVSPETKKIKTVVVFRKKRYLMIMFSTGLGMLFIQTHVKGKKIGTAAIFSCA